MTNISETNFNLIRQQIKDYFKTKPEFTDYNFDGSTSAVLIDILAYNSFYGNVHANMAFSETFLDTANQRSSVVSRAKELNYLPRSEQGAIATVRLSFAVTGNPSQYILPRNTRFSTTINGDTYIFVTPEEYVFNNVGNVFTGNIDIVQGVISQYEYTINIADLTQRIIIPSLDVDLRYLTVYKKNSASDAEFFQMQNASELDLYDIDNQSELFFLQESFDGYYELNFGDNFIGKAVENGNVILLDYLITDAEEANGALSFALGSNLTGVLGLTITTIDNAIGGVPRETIESIKFNAPMFYESQGRAVTENDYKAIFLNRYGNIEDIRVWGGEKNDPPYYGKVYVAIKPLTDTVFTNSQKEAIVEDVISKYNIVGIRPEIVDPDYIYVSIHTNVTYNSLLFSRVGNVNLEQAVTDNIVNFFDSTVNKFGAPLYFSKLVSTIDNTSPVIKSSITNIVLERRLPIIPQISTQYKFLFNNSVALNSVKSNTIIVNGISYIIKDVPAASNSTTGVLTLYTLDNIVAQNNIGTVNYNTGEVIIQNFKIDDILNDPVSKILTMTVAQGNFIDPLTPQYITTDYNIYPNEREDIIVLSDGGIIVTLVSDNA